MFVGALTHPLPNVFLDAKFKINHHTYRRNQRPAGARQGRCQKVGTCSTIRAAGAGPALTARAFSGGVDTLLKSRPNRR